LKQGQRVLVASCADHRRRPDHGEDLDRLLLAAADRFDLVGLKLRHGKSRCPSIAEATTGAGGPFRPAINRIPGNSLDSSDGRLIQPFDAESATSSNVARSCWRR
jgi:hypothetical protein